MTWQIRQREAELLGEKRGIAIGEERGEKRGIAIGEKRGEERGIAIGEERGITIGEKRGKLETARAMLRELPMDQVARFTGLSREELQRGCATAGDLRQWCGRADQSSSCRAAVPYSAGLFRTRP